MLYKTANFKQKKKSRLFQGGSSFLVPEAAASLQLLHCGTYSILFNHCRMIHCIMYMQKHEESMYTANEVHLQALLLSLHGLCLAVSGIWARNNRSQYTSNKINRLIRGTTRKIFNRQMKCVSLQFNPWLVNFVGVVITLRLSDS